MSYGRWRFVSSQIESMAAPCVQLWLRNQSCFHRVQVNVAHHLRQIVILVHYNRLIAPLEKSTVAAVKSVESLRVESIEMLHHPGEISLGRAQTHVISIVAKVMAIL